MSMSPAYQPLHILRKDATHLWPETLVSIALLIAFAWSEAQTWLPSDGTFNPAVLAVGFLKFLIPVAWLVLISRLVHDEELVGDRQFWITRPYTWYSLLLSKILFVAIFIGGPFLIMQMWLLHHAGLYPSLLIPALLKNLIYVAAIFLLPLFAIAAATSTFVRYISSVIGGILYFFTVMVLAAYNWSDRLDAPYLGYLLSATLLGLLVAAILLMYWRRKTLISRILIAIVPLMIIVFALLSPLNLLTAHRYANASPGTLAFNTNVELDQSAGKLFTARHQVFLTLPVQLQMTGLPEHSTLEVQRFRVTIDGPSGYHYASDWSATHAAFSARQNASAIPFSIPEAVFNRIHTQPVAVHLQLGTQITNAGTPYSVDASETAFPLLPEHAACTLSSEQGTLECRFAFANPTFQHVEATVHDGNCLTPGHQSARAMSNLAPTEVPFDFSPVEIVQVPLKLGTSTIPLCSGTRLTFTPAVEGAYGRLSLDIPTITLDGYALRLKPTPTSAPNPNTEP